MTLRLTSSTFNDGDRIPVRYTCDGEDLSPPLSWSGAPDGTGSFALLCDDPDAPAGTWHHWAVFDIPAHIDHLDEGYPTSERVDSVRQAINDFDRSGYGGPCPPPGHGTHRYRFRLLALGVAALDLPHRVRCPEVGHAARPHVLAEVELMGTYSR